MAWYQPQTPEEEAEFFASLRLRNGTFKTTAHRRLDGLNAVVSDHWRQSGFRPESILDIGVSSGTSTVEWLEAMRRDGLDPRFVGTDLTLWAELISIGPIYQVLTSSGNVLRHAVFGFDARTWIEPKDYFTGYAAAIYVANIVAFFGHRLPILKRKLPLLTQAALNSSVEWLYDDILSKPTSYMLGKFDVVRAANILNKGYFDRQSVAIAVQNVRERLSGPGSYFIVNRTHSDGSNHGTIFEMGSDGRFSTRCSIGQGSEISDIVTSS